MNGKKAKKLRRQAYGDRPADRESRKYGVVGGKKIMTKDGKDYYRSGSLVCLDDRTTYKDLKREL